jgi:formylmethanofuran dehydrogenase subunit A
MPFTTLPGITREYTWPEIATMTRTSPARLLGLADRGHLAPGARADVAVYRPQSDAATMFRAAELVFMVGRLIFRQGDAVETVSGRVLTVQPGFDSAIERRLDDFYDQIYGIPHGAFDVPDWLIASEIVPCAR